MEETKTMLDTYIMATSWVQWLAFKLNYLNALCVFVSILYYTDVLWDIKKEYRLKYTMLRSWLLVLPVIAFAIAFMFLVQYEISSLNEVYLMLALLPAKIAKGLLMFWINKFHKKHLLRK